MFAVSTLSWQVTQLALSLSLPTPSELWAKFARSSAGSESTLLLFLFDVGQKGKWKREKSENKIAENRKIHKFFSPLICLACGVDFCFLFFVFYFVFFFSWFDSVWFNCGQRGVYAMCENTKSAGLRTANCGRSNNENREERDWEEERKRGREWQRETRNNYPDLRALATRWQAPANPTLATARG